MSGISALRRASLILVLLVSCLVATVPRAAEAHGPGDSRVLFQEVQRLLQRGAFEDVVDLLDHVETEHPYDDVIARARHWRAFARWRMGDPASLRAAKDELTALVTELPEHAVRLDTASLCDRLARSLAASDDPWAAAEVEELAARVREFAEARRNEESR